jgi:hypothetical protein
MKSSIVNLRCEIVEVFSTIFIIQMIAIFAVDYLGIGINRDQQFVGFLVYFIICSSLYGFAPKLVSIINKNLNEGTTEKVCN